MIESAKLSEHQKSQKALKFRRTDLKQTQIEQLAETFELANENSDELNKKIKF